MNAGYLTKVDSLGLPFLLSVPERATAGEKPWPVLVFLHGLQEGAPTEIFAGVTAHGPLSPKSSTLATERFIVAAPQLPAQGDIWELHAETVCEIVAEVQRTCGGDPERTYLTGFSFGGNGVFDLALLRPRLWAALWPVDPTRVPASDPGHPIWLSSGQASRPNHTRFLHRLELLPNVTGTEDRVFTEEWLDHVATATSAYRNDRIYKWLLSKLRQPKP